MTNSIVQVNVSTTQAPAPSTLQRTGAIISQGGTSLTPNTTRLITQPSDLTPLLSAAQSLTALTSTSTTATATIAGGHGWQVGDVLAAVITGVLPAGYNGAVNISITSATQFTYTVVSGLTSPATQLGTIVLADRAELLSQITTFFEQGSSLSVYILELGAGTVDDGVAGVTAFIAANALPQVIYSYLVPKEWDGVTSYLTLLGQFNSTTAKTYFFTTSTAATYTAYSAVQKCCFVFVPAPLASALEFGCAAPFWVTLNYNPGSTNKVTPLSFAFLFGVTPYPTTGNGALLTAFRAANVNFADTGAEGGISNVILKWGYLKDGKPFSFWYSVDYAAINLQLALANAVINGSNNPLAPLYYNQQGINVLQDVATRVFNSMVSFGLAVGNVAQETLSGSDFAANFLAGKYRGELVINAEPFLIYTAENPSDYAIGKYAGFGAILTPLRGFESIIFDLNATNFI